MVKNARSPKTKMQSQDTRLLPIHPVEDKVDKVVVVGTVVEDVMVVVDEAKAHLHDDQVLLRKT